MNSGDQEKSRFINFAEGETKYFDLQKNWLFISRIDANRFARFQGTHGDAASSALVKRVLRAFAIPTGYADSFGCVNTQSACMTGPR